MQAYQSLAEVLDTVPPDAGRITYIDRADSERVVRYCELRTRALGILRILQDRGLGREDKLVVFLNSNEQLVDVFWACLLGGIVPVPVAAGASDEHKLKLLRIIGRLDRAGLYSDAKTLERLGRFAAAQGLEAAFAGIRESAVLVEQITDITRAGTVVPSAPDDLAFIQFSSGSTSDPKGVALTHRNLLTNINAIIDAAEFSPDDRMLSWMPLTHDMGLIGFHLTPLCHRIDQVIMATDVFIRRPVLWMKEVNRHRSTLLGSPNFGYRHYLKAIRKKAPEGLDLACVRLIFNGAEPISAVLCEEFSAKMTRYGLRPEAMFPVYGLAEASLAVTFPPCGRALKTLRVDRRHLGIGDSVIEAAVDQPALRLVGVGQPIRDCRVRLMDEAAQPVAEQVVGHIEISGNNVTQGYYRDEAANRQLISAGGWLDTGDLGFFSQGELFITGRSREIIFVNGQNHYPQDIEAVVHALDAAEMGKVAAVGVRSLDDSEDELLLFVLHRGDARSFLPVARSMAAHVNQQEGLEVTHVIPVAHIPKTTSGKLQRQQLGERYLQGEFTVELETLERLLKESHPPAGQGRTAIERRLKKICDEAIPEKDVSIEESLFEIGTSSLALVQIHEGIEEAFPGMVEIADLFDYPSIASLAARLEVLAAGSAD